MDSAARAPDWRDCPGASRARRSACAARESATSTAAQLFYAKIELLIFIGHLYVPDVSFAPHQ
ncbi:hypothetical protein F7R21_17995 [Burkholderia latens]|uniref:Uncharacterized protein n=1 Tax=Burkholderia latens TaxID=488446 RepID=A0A6H9SQ42_9BURK|nr:hypothetical protein F7R21_17995 [Burkholderia latens]